MGSPVHSVALDMEVGGLTEWQLRRMLVTSGNDFVNVVENEYFCMNMVSSVQCGGERGGSRAGRLL